MLELSLSVQLFSPPRRLTYCHVATCIAADGVESEISLIHDDDINWFLTLDETHHPYSTVGNKGGSTTRRYASSSFHCSGERCIENSSHTTGVYGTTCASEPLPPLYILSSKAKDENNFGYDPKVHTTLPVVLAKYADDEYKEYHAHCSVRSCGSMDTSLWHLLNREIYIPCFEGKISKEPIRDPVTKKLISGPLVVKTDSGPGRLSVEADSLEFRTEMAEKGVHILLSLPNATAATEEGEECTVHNTRGRGRPG